MSNCRFHPETGEPLAVPVDAHYLRRDFARFVFDPWTGVQRSEVCIERDPAGTFLEDIRTTERTT